MIENDDYSDLEDDGFNYKKVNSYLYDDTLNNDDILSNDDYNYSNLDDYDSVLRNKYDE